MKKQLEKKINWRLTLQLFLSILTLYLFYELGFNFYLILLIGAILLAIIIFKGKLYKRLDNFLIYKLPFLSKQKPWVRRLIVIIIFVLLYIALKQIIFLILKQFGIDFQQMISNNINQSMTK